MWLPVFKTTHHHPTLSPRSMKCCLHIIKVKLFQLTPTQFLSLAFSTKFCLKLKGILIELHHLLILQIILLRCSGECGWYIHVQDAYTFYKLYYIKGVCRINSPLYAWSDLDWKWSRLTIYGSFWRKKRRAFASASESKHYFATLFPFLQFRYEWMSRW